FHRGVDLGLGLLMNPDRLRVAATLEVEYSRVAPAVLVVADQAPLGIGRQRGLAGSAESEEKGLVATVLVDVGRTVHRKHPLGREQVVECGEDRLLDLARVFGAADENHAAPEVDEDERFAMGPMLSGVGLDGWQRRDWEVGC